MRQFRPAVPAALVTLGLLTGCGHSQPPINNAPPVMQSSAPPVMQTSAAAPVGGNGVYNWRDVPANERIPVMRAVFDQGGYQIFARTGETIVVPFENNNLYVMQFGRSSSGDYYFENTGGTPILYVPMGGFLENAAAQGAKWYPLPNDFAYTRPVYVGLAPTWNDYVGMGWYPGMSYYGGLWGYNYSPGIRFAWMPGFNIHIGGSVYRDYGAYHTYYTRTGGYTPNRVVYNNYTTRSQGTGSWSNRPNRTNYNSTRLGGTGSFRNGTSGTSGTINRSSGFGSGTFGGNRSANTGSFSTGRTFGSGSGSGTFRSGGSSGGSSGSTFGGSNRSSFGGSGSTFGGSGTRSSGGSFGGSTRSTGSSFGSSSGRAGGSFGGGSRSSSGGSFGRRR